MSTCSKRRRESLEGESETGSETGRGVKSDGGCGACFGSGRCGSLKRRHFRHEEGGHVLSHTLLCTVHTITICSCALNVNISSVSFRSTVTHTGPLLHSGEDAHTQHGFLALFNEPPADCAGPAFHRACGVGQQQVMYIFWSFQCLVSVIS